MKHFVMIMIALLCLTPRLQGQAFSSPPETAATSIDTIVYPVRSGDASDLAQTLIGIYQDANIAAVTESNVLLIHVNNDLRDVILSTLTQLDQPKRTIVVQAWLLKSHGKPLSADETAAFSGPRDQVLQRIEALRNSDQVSVANRIQLTTLENQEAMVQIGQRQPVVSGTTITATRSRANTYQQVQTGTLLSVTARVTPDDAIVMDIDFEKSELNPMATSDDEEPGSSLTSVSTLVNQTTLQIEDGEAALAGTITGKPNVEEIHSYLIVTASAGDRGSDRSSRAATATTPDRATKPDSTRGAMPGGSGSGRTIGSFERRQPSNAGEFPSSEARFEAMAVSLFERLDRDHDGLLDDEERGRITASMRSSFSEDGPITLAEFRKALMARATSNPTKGPATAQPSSPRDRYLQYTQSIVDKYDTDSDGRLSADERGKMSRDPSAADVNNDGFVTVEELAEFYKSR